MFYICMVCLHDGKLNNAMVLSVIFYRGIRSGQHNLSIVLSWYSPSALGVHNLIVIFRQNESDFYIIYRMVAYKFNRLFREKAQ